MKELARIQETLRRAAVRRRLHRALRGLWTGLFLGTALWVLVLAAYKVIPFPPAIVEWGWLLPAAGAAFGFAWGGRRPLSLAHAARLLEDRQPVNSRFSTALEISQSPAAGDWSRLVVSDAARALQALQPAKVLPLGLPALARWIPALLGLIIGLGFVPEYRSQRYLAAQREADQIEDTGKSLAAWIRQDLERRDPTTPAVREALEETAAMAERWSEVRLTKAEAVQDLAQAAQRLADEARQLGTRSALNPFQAAARAPRPTPANTPSQSGDRDRAGQSSLPPSMDASAQMAQDLENALQQVAEMQDPSGATTPEALSQALESLLQVSAQFGLDLPSLDDALNALAAGDLDSLRDLLEQAAKDLAQRGGMDSPTSDLRQLADLLKALEAAQLAMLNNQRWRPGSDCEGASCGSCSQCGGGSPGSGGQPSLRLLTGKEAESVLAMTFPGGSLGGSKAGTGSQPESHGMAPIDPELPENGFQTRIRGQLSPAPMPAVTLKGVSLRGQSSVPYREAVEAAQSDARSALNQDQVPRAYRSAVRGYFDDLP